MSPLWGRGGSILILRVRCEVTGAVQGVGFRPFVYGLASRLGLGGFVLNEPQGVKLELEGEESKIASFLEEIKINPPPLARIQDIKTSELSPLGEREFSIILSRQDGERTVLISPDIATCQDCLNELFDKKDRRYRYPFINCTNCGPRYTIISDIPYDRARTTMAKFVMCSDCLSEYEDPTNRRYHAEPTCCPVCGPKVELLDRSGDTISCDDPVAEAVRRLSDGEIVAVKGLGGFHLACDASNEDAVKRLRKRKGRDKKPFAIMARDISVVDKISKIDQKSKDILTGIERPILLLEKRPDSGISDEVAPKSDSFGVMLPYTPIHLLLMESNYSALVMTSGNITDEPIAHTNDDARERLDDLADFFLIHDRDIYIRTDDSVTRIIEGEKRFIRRSRGYAPFPIEIPKDTSGREILAVGAELNSTIALTRGRYAFLSHHIGDLKNVAAYEAFLQAIGHLKDILEVEPKVLAFDLHPDYLSTRYAKGSGLFLIPVQHHHAHIASVLAEAGRTDRVIGVAYDGMGWGDDDTLWGGEFLVSDLTGYKRLGYLAPLHQPGGDVTAKRPVRMAYIYLKEAFGEKADTLAPELLSSLEVGEMRIVSQLIEKDVNSPLTSSIGRLFDAASAILGICDVNTYHSQAPIELEAEASKASDEDGHYPFRILQDGSGAWIIHASDIICGLVMDFTGGTGAEICAARFHNSVAEATLDMCKKIRDETRISIVALSGGVFANKFLTEKVVPILEREGFEVLLNQDVPAGDGGISLGQAAIAAWRTDGV